MGLESLSPRFADTGLGADIATQVGKVIAQTLPSDARQQLFSSGQLSIWGDGLGAFVFQVPRNCLQEAINSLNTWDQQSGGLAFEYNYPNGPNFPIEITGASPDWYTIAAAGDFTPCCGNGVGGSPGGHPTAASATATSTSSTAGGGETVYVLDTADPLNASTSAPDPDQVPGLCPSDPTTKTVDKTTACYKELKDLSNVTLEMDWPVRDEQAYLPDYGNSTDTTIREHGLFISDLIHHVAPKATINLLRTLNDHGAGDILDLMGSLRYVLAHGPSGAIVNMSLTTVLSPGCLLDVWHNWQSKYFSPAQKGTLECDTPGTLTSIEVPSLKLMFTQLSLLIQALQDHGDLLVAAAGAHAADSDATADATSSNDSETPADADDVYAGMPAAFCGVRAVAAENKPVTSNWGVLYTQPTSFLAVFSSGSVSNLPYLSSGNCLQIPQGSANYLNNVLRAGGSAPPPMPQVSATNQNDAVAALGVGVCSVYPQNTSSIPAAPPAGWATWDGTSFATALISGNLAANKDSLPSTLDESQPCQVQ